DVAQRGVERLELFGVIGSGHNTQPYASTLARVHSRGPCLLARAPLARARGGVGPSHAVGTILSQASSALWYPTATSSAAAACSSPSRRNSLAASRASLSAA